MKTFHCFVAGNPKGQPRPRAFVLHGHARVYDAHTAEGWKSLIALAVKWAGITKFEGAVYLRAEFFFSRPKSHFNKSGLKPSSPKHHTSRPDLDNLEKAAMDALTHLGAWIDDSYVVQKETYKHWTVAAAGCHITITDV